MPKYGKKTNKNVVWSWMNNKPLKSSGMHTDGKDLYSYNLLIGYTIPSLDDAKFVKDYTASGLGFYSMTTSTHVNLAKRYADIVS